MNTSLFQWAKDEGLTMGELAKKVGCSVRQLYRIRQGEYPVTESFKGRVIFRLGDWARVLFFDDMSLTTDEKSVPTQEAPHG